MSVGDIAQLILATTTGIAAIIAAVASALAKRAASLAHREVVTLNRLTIGQLAARAETRRILSEPPDGRTPEEIEHLRESPLTE